MLCHHTFSFRLLEHCRAEQTLSSLGFPGFFSLHISGVWLSGSFSPFLVVRVCHGRVYLWWNRCGGDEMNFRGEILYNSEEDLHYPKIDSEGYSLVRPTDKTPAYRLPRHWGNTWCVHGRISESYCKVILDRKYFEHSHRQRHHPWNFRGREEEGIHRRGTGNEGQLPMLG
jgi:hypothetical protein